MTHIGRIALTVVCLSSLVACGAMGDRSGATGGPVAVATLEPTRGNDTRGTVEFRTQGDSVVVRAIVTGLKPNQAHGFHIHEKGDCGSGDGMSAGGHFNPTGKPHGPPDADHHAGDLPALMGDAQGRADVQFVVKGVSIGGGVADIVGKGLIVHAQADDYRTQPTGNSGARIACAVIGRKP